MRYPSLAYAAALVGASLMYCSGAAGCPDVKKAPSKMLTIDESGNGRPTNIRLNESVQIILSENATTGYRWEIDHYDEEFIEALATEPRYAENAVGSGGEVAFLFRGKKIGTGEIVLKKWRHWAGETSVIARFHIKLHVRP